MSLDSYFGLDGVADYLFLILGVLSLLFAVATVYVSHILRAATCLMAVLCLSAGFYVLLGAELLAGVQILVYVGGIVVLLVIAVMLTQNESLGHDQATVKRKVLAAIGSVSFFVTSSYLLSQSSLKSSVSALGSSATTAATAAATTVAVGESAIKGIGLALLNPGAGGYLLPFEVISLLLLAVLVAGIVIARKETP